MREARVKLETEAYYNCTNRCLNKEYFLADDREKQRLLTLLKQTAGFAGITILNYCIMDNHFHVQIHVPDKKTYIDTLELSVRLRSLYGKRRAESIAYQIQELQNMGLQAEAEIRIRGYLARMHDVSEFMKTVKQRFTESYNKRHNRSGTLWGGRFHSVLVHNNKLHCLYLTMFDQTDFFCLDARRFLPFTLKNGGYILQIEAVFPI